MLSPCHLPMSCFMGRVETPAGIFYVKKGPLALWGFQSLISLLSWLLRDCRVFSPISDFYPLDVKNVSRFV